MYSLLILIIAISQMSAATLQHDSIKDMKVAFCHPVLFGNTNITRLETFLNYYRILGFDQFYFWSEPDPLVESFLNSQEDVQFSVFDAEAEIEKYGFENYPPGYGGGEADHYHGQNVAIQSCLKQTEAAGFDWALFGDNDEFLFWSGDFDLHSFLGKFSRFSAVSLGKILHTREYCSHREKGNKLDLFSFLYRSESGFCSEINDLGRHYDNCDTYFGRRKYFVQPKYITKLQIHEPTLFEGDIVDLDTRTAHMKEIVGYNEYTECQHTHNGYSIQYDALPSDFHGDDLSAFQTRNEQLSLIKDFEFERWLQNMYNIEPTEETEDLELRHFQQYLDQVFTNPCENEIELVQKWDSCGFGCAVTAYTTQILESYIQGKTFTIGFHHLDYHRHFRNVFEESAFPICGTNRVHAKPQMETINPHEFFLDRIKNAHVEARMRPLIRYITTKIWSFLSVNVRNYVFYSKSQAKLPKSYTAIHVRRDDKCTEEARCVQFAEYFEHIEDPETPLFVMTDENLKTLRAEINACCSEARILSMQAYQDSPEELPQLITEIVVALRANEIVCTGSSNICRLLWALSPKKTVFHNVDTTSILCGDARDAACLFENADINFWELQNSLRHMSGIVKNALLSEEELLQAGEMERRELHRWMETFEAKPPSRASTEVPPDDDPEAEESQETGTKPPTSTPTLTPTQDPTLDPTSDPSLHPTANPSLNPSVNPTIDPTLTPSLPPSSSPTLTPTINPTDSPSFSPSSNPTSHPSKSPTKIPSMAPSSEPSFSPTGNPSTFPTQCPSQTPTFMPSLIPTDKCTAAPTADPTSSPTANPSRAPTLEPTQPANLCTLANVGLDHVTREICEDSSEACEAYIKKGTLNRVDVVTGDDYCRAIGLNCFAMFDDHNTCRPYGTQYRSCQDTGGTSSDHIVRCVGPYNPIPTPYPTVSGLCEVVGIMDENDDIAHPDMTKEICVNTPDRCEVYMKRRTIADLNNGQKIEDGNDYCGAFGLICLEMWDDLNSCTRGGIGQYASCEVPSSDVSSDHIIICAPPPTKEPTKIPTNVPTKNPAQGTVITLDPTKVPTSNPTTNPSKGPTQSPLKPTKVPTTNPSRSPTSEPTKNPSTPATKEPTKVPTQSPLKPTKGPTKVPTQSPLKPTKGPTQAPTKVPTTNPSRSFSPTSEPTKNPSRSFSPTSNPTASPSRSFSPTSNPTTNPSKFRSLSPTAEPTRARDESVRMVASVSGATEGNRNDICASIADGVDGTVTHCGFSPASGRRMLSDPVNLYVDAKVVSTSAAENSIESSSYTSSLQVPSGVTVHSVSVYVECDTEAVKAWTDLQTCAADSRNGRRRLSGTAQLEDLISQNTDLAIQVNDLSTQNSGQSFELDQLRAENEEYKKRVSQLEALMAQALTRIERLEKQENKVVVL